LSQRMWLQPLLRSLETAGLRRRMVRSEFHFLIKQIAALLKALPGCELGLCLVGGSRALASFGRLLPLRCSTRSDAPLSRCRVFFADGALFRASRACRCFLPCSLFGSFAVERFCAAGPFAPARAGAASVRSRLAFGAARSPGGFSLQFTLRGRTGGLRELTPGFSSAGFTNRVS